jgi:AraC-like DNA-binding protein
VEYLWWLSDKPLHARERIMASGTQELVINLHEDSFEIRSAADDARVRRFSGAMVSGAYSRYFVIDTRAHVSLLGIHFKPGGAWPILGTPPGELADTHVDLSALWGAMARELREQLGAATTTQERFRFLEAALVARLSHPCRCNSVVPAAMRSLMRGDISVGQVATDLGLSRRRLIELFTAEVGMTPKLFGRVQRFQRTLALARSSTLSWAEVAPQAGYCDQSHLIRDFVTFSGLAPTTLVANLGPQLKENHVTQPLG